MNHLSSIRILKILIHFSRCQKLHLKLKISFGLINLPQKISSQINALKTSTVLSRSWTVIYAMGPRFPTCLYYCLILSLGLQRTLRQWMQSSCQSCLVFLMTASVHVYSHLLPVRLWLLPCVGRSFSISPTGPHSAPENRWKNYLCSGVISSQINLRILCFKRPSFLRLTGRPTCVDPQINLLLHCPHAPTTRAGKATNGLFVAPTSPIFVDQGPTFLAQQPTRLLFPNPLQLRQHPLAQPTVSRLKDHRPPQMRKASPWPYPFCQFPEGHLRCESNHCWLWVDPLCKPRVHQR